MRAIRAFFELCALGPRGVLTSTIIRRRQLGAMGDAETAKGWLFCTNTRLDDQAPIEMLRAVESPEQFTAIVRAEPVGEPSDVSHAPTERVYLAGGILHDQFGLIRRRSASGGVSAIHIEFGPRLTKLKEFR